MKTGMLEWLYRGAVLLLLFSIVFLLTMAIPRLTLLAVQADGILLRLENMAMREEAIQNGTDPRDLPPVVTREDARRARAAMGN